MALQGTLDTFALADVLRLLANTRKSGRLEIDGDRGTGRVWLGDGLMVGGEAPEGSRTDGVHEVIFHLLRFETGEFEFLTDDLPGHPAGPFEVEEVLIEAEQSLAEWRDIEAVVPSMEGWVTLVPELEAEDRTVKLGAADWQLVAAVGSGTRVVDLAEALEATDLAMCRAVKAMVERDLVAVGDPATAGESAPVDTAEPEAADLADPVDTEAMDEFEQEMAADEPEAEQAAAEDVALEADAEAEADTEYFVEDGVSHTARARLDVLTAAYVDETDRTDASDALRNLMPEPLPGAGLTNGQLDDADIDGPFFTGDTPAAEAAPAADAAPAPAPAAETPTPAPAAESPVEAAYAGFAEPPVAGEQAPQEPVEADPELARQLSTLSPQAAAAIASAAGSINDPGRDPFPGRVRRNRSNSRTR